MVDFEVDRSRALWWAVGLALFAVVAYVVTSFIGTFVFGVFIYYATRPVYRRLVRRTRHRNLAAAVALGAFALPIVGLLVYTLAIAIQELQHLQQVNVDPINSAVQPYLNASSIVENPASLLSDPGGLETLRTTADAALGYLGLIGNGLLHLFVMLALAFYLLRDGGRLVRWVVQFGDDRGVVEQYVEAVDRSFSNIFFGNILNAIMTGAIGAISFSLLNYVAPPGLAIPYPALTGLLAGVASLVPIVGMKLVYVPLVALLGIRAAMQDAGLAFVFVVFVVSLVVVDMVPDLVLRPYVSGRNLHVGLVMFAYILGPLLFGWYGIFLGPILLVLVFHFGRIVLPELLAGEPIRPVAVDPAHLTTPPDPAPPEDPDTRISADGVGDDVNADASED